MVLLGLKSLIICQEKKRESHAFEQIQVVISVHWPLILWNRNQLLAKMLKYN